MTKIQYKTFLEALDEYLSVYGAYPYNRGDFKAGFCLAWDYLNRNRKKPVKKKKRDK